MHCISCGKEIGDGVSFCPFCGGRIDASAKESKVDGSTTAASEYVAHQQSPECRLGVVSGNEQGIKANASDAVSFSDEPSSTFIPKGSHRGLIAGIICGVIAVAAGVIVAIAVFAGSESYSNSPEGVAQHVSDVVEYNANQALWHRDESVNKYLMPAIDEVTSLAPNEWQNGMRAYLYTSLDSDSDCLVELTDKFSAGYIDAETMNLVFGADWLIRCEVENIDYSSALDILDTGLSEWADLYGTKLSNSPSSVATGDLAIYITIPDDDLDSIHESWGLDRTRVDSNGEIKWCKIELGFVEVDSEWYLAEAGCAQQIDIS